MTRVLVVDDEFATREVLARSLVGEGYDVEKAADAAQAWARLGESAFDVAIVDRTLPDAKGEALIARIRVDARFGAMKILLLVEPYGRRIELEGVTILVKPIVLDEVLAALA